MIAVVTPIWYLLWYYIMIFCSFVLLRQLFWSIFCDTKCNSCVVPILWQLFCYNYYKEVDNKGRNCFWRSPWVSVRGLWGRRGKVVVGQSVRPHYREPDPGRFMVVWCWAGSNLRGRLHFGGMVCMAMIEKGEPVRFSLHRALDRFSLQVAMSVCVCVCLFLRCHPVWCDSCVGRTGLRSTISSTRDCSKGSPTLSPQYFWTAES